MSNAARRKPKSETPSPALDTSPKERGRPSVYPWDQWFNGQKWQLYRDKTYTCNDQSMARSIRHAAKRYNKDVSVRTNEHGVLITPRQRPDTSSAQPLVE